MKFDGIAKTSLLVAATRAVEHKRSETEGRLFSDPFAERLAGSEGLEMYEKARAVAGDQPAIAVRTRYFDDHVTQAITQGIRQVVVLAAGMDARAYRLKFPDGVRIFELDRQEVLDYKQEKLGTAQPLCKRTAVAVDLREDWQSKLTQAGMNPAQPTLWILEGLIVYLDEASVLTLFKKVDALSAPNSVMLFDLMGRSLLNAPHMAKQLEYLEKFGAPWLFGFDEPEKFTEQFGWKATATQPGEVAPSRWPFPVAPRHVPNVPRSFFVEARKLGSGT